MLIWLTSFPRSGNTFLRIVLHRRYGLGSSTVYPVDGVAERLGAELIGYVGQPALLDELRRSAGVHLVKTHRQRDADVHPVDPAICLVRDGRDALVSYARQRVEVDGGIFEDRLVELIERDKPTGTTSWGRTVLSWIQDAPEHRPLLRYEDLVADPPGAVDAAMSRVAPDLAPDTTAELPGFAALHATDPGFFRRGRTGSHVDEMPNALQELFWSKPDNAEAMALLGYAF